MDADTVAQNRDAGVDRIVFSLPSEAADSILPKLDDIAKLAD